MFNYVPSLLSIPQIFSQNTLWAYLSIIKDDVYSEFCWYEIQLSSFVYRRIFDINYLSLDYLIIILSCDYSFKFDQINSYKNKAKYKGLFRS